MTNPSGASNGLPATGGVLPRGERLIVFLESLRRGLTRTAIAIVLFSCGGFYLARPVLAHLVSRTGVELVAFGIPETFFSFLNLSLAIGAFGAAPMVLLLFLAPLPSLYPQFPRPTMWVFWTMGSLLFYAGAFFCLGISLPYGAQFLLSFAGERIAAYVSVHKFIGFCALFVFGFGLIFELPLLMMVLGRIGMVRAEQLAGSRRYAILAITVVAAVLTPTPDLFNLALMGVPLYLLFELGIVGMRLWKAPPAPTEPPSDK
jgi:sec-independent protein translocase protein TatC